MGRTTVFASELFNVKIPKGEGYYLFLKKLQLYNLEV